MPKTIYLITGATGLVGRELVRLLATVQPHAEIRCATRDIRSESASALRKLGSNVFPATFDTNRLVTMVEAFRNVTHLYLLPPPIAEMTEWVQYALAAAEAAEARPFVLKQSIMPVQKVEAQEACPSVCHYHSAGERLLQASGLAHAVLRSNLFMQNIIRYSWIFSPKEDRLYLPLRGKGIAWFDARDMAYFAASLLAGTATLDELRGKIFHLSGPEVLSGREIVEILCSISGRRIGDGYVSMEEFAGRMVSLGATKQEACQTVALFKLCETEPSFAAHYTDFTALTGRQPRSFAAFAQDFSQHFQNQVGGARAANR